MRILSILLLLVLSVQVRAYDTNPAGPSQRHIQFWPNDFFSHLSYDLGQELDDTSVKLSYAIFDAIVEQTIFSRKLASMQLALKIDRDIFYNSDIYRSYTVVDYFKLPISLPVNRSFELPSSAIGLGLNLSTSLEFSLLNIRQVKPESLHALESVDSIRTQLRQSEASLSDNKRQDAGKPLNKDLVDFILIDRENPLKQAMYHDLWNLITNPLHLPVTKNNFAKMDQNEIYTYSLNGVVQFGGSVGWSQVIVQGLDTNLGVGMSTYLAGQFRVSIMKEQESVALLKVSRIRGRGNSTFFGVRDSHLTLFEGFTVLDHDHVGKVSLKVIPFLFTAAKQLNRTVDVAYRYDFTKKTAWKAYKQAMKGMLKLSENLAQQENSGVTHAFDRTKYTTELSSRYKMNLLLVFEKGRTTKAAFSHAVVKLPNKQYKTFQAVSETSRFHDFFLSQKEQKSYRFNLIIDEHHDLRSSVGKNLRVSMKIFDTRTYGDELAQYAQEMEFVVGKPNLLPRVPIYAPVPDGAMICSTDVPVNNSGNCYRPHKINYGEGQFSYMMDFSGEQIFQLLDLSKRELWQALERGFGVKENSWRSKLSRFLFQTVRTPVTLLNVPLLTADLHIKSGNKFYAAWKFYRKWKKVKKSKDALTFVQHFSKMFKSAFFSKEYLYSLIYAVGRAPRIDYHAYNRELFGTIARSHVVGRSLGQEMEDAERVFAFDRVGSRDFHIDRNSIISSFKAKDIDGDSVEFEIVLPKKGKTPQYIFFRLDYKRGLRYKNLLQGVVMNNNTLKPGKNIITIHRGDHNGIFGKIAKQIFNDQIHRRNIIFALATGQDGNRWGAIAETKLQLPE